MEIELSRLSAEELPLRGELRLDDGALGAGGRSLASQGIRFPEPFRLDAAARRPERELLVSGRIDGSVRLDCSRCAEPFEQGIELDFAARYAPHPEPAPPDAEDGSGQDGIEIERDDLDLSFYPAGTTSLSVEELVREQVLLDLPVRALCREDCRGLCSACGANLNAGDCGCDREEPGDPRLAPLLELKRKLQDE